MDAQQQRLKAAICANDIVTIILGPDRLQYMVHGALLSEESRYFKKALTRPSKGAEDRIVRLRDVGSDYRETFDTFVAWIYTRSLPSIGNTLSNTDEDQRWETSAVKAYIFSDRFEAVGFKRAMLQQFIEFFVSPANGGVPFFNTIVLAFNHLPENDPFLRLLVDVYCRNYDPANDSDRELRDRKDLPHAFLLRVMLRYSESCRCLRASLDMNDYKLDRMVEDADSMEN